MPWEIHLYALGDTYLYMFSLRGGARTDLYTCLVTSPPPIWFGKELCMDIVYTYGYNVHMWILYILYTRMDTLLKLPPGGFRWKTEKISSKNISDKSSIFRTKASE